MSLTLTGIAASPGGTDVLRGVDLDVPTGTCLAVLGPSGAGKTTLLRVVAGLERPTAGHVEVDGTGLDGTPPDRRKLAVVFQDARLFPNMSVAENVGFPLKMAGADADERRRRAAEMLAEVGLVAFDGRRPRTLSGGEAQRVALARALVTEPRALLLDEPFAAVDPERRDDLRRLVNRLRRDHKLTTLLVTHDRDDAALLGDHVAVLLDGVIAQAGEVREVFDRPISPAVAEFVGCDVEVIVDGIRHVTRPEHVVLGTGPYRGTVTAVHPASDHVRVELTGGEGMPQVTSRVAVHDAPDVGATVAFDLPHLHPLP